MDFGGAKHSWRHSTPAFDEVSPHKSPRELPMIGISESTSNSLQATPYYTRPYTQPGDHGDGRGRHEQRITRIPVAGNSGSTMMPLKRGMSHRLTVARTDSYPDIKLVIAQTSPLRLDLTKWLATKNATRAELVIAHMLRSGPGHGMTEPQSRVASYAACVHLDPLESYDVWCDGQHISSSPLRPGTIHISDMRRTWCADLRSAFNVVNFFIPQASLDDIADEQGSSHVEELHCPIALGRVDTVLHNLALALLPAVAAPERANTLFVDCASRAVVAHLMKTYGSRRSAPRYVRGGLASWQGRRAKELLMASLSGDITLGELAYACRLSPSHFCRAFSQTFGCPPHRWLTAQRVEKAKALILNTNRPMSEIALSAGFADQSHFTRVFSRYVGTTPSVWRRAQMG